MKCNFLLELGTEELPTDSLEVLETSFRTVFERKLREARLSFQKLEVELTPRRLVSFTGGLPSKQEPQVLESVGPAWDKAYDAQGNSTPALQGFIRSKGLAEKNIYKKDTPRGAYVASKVTLEGLKVDEVLPGLVTQTLAELPFPKAMRWDDTKVSFPRPIRWILALLNGKVLRISYGRVRSDRFTFGHRFLAPGRVAVARADMALFRKTMEKMHVVLRLEERKDLIRRRLIQKTGGTRCDDELVSIAAQLVEEPFLVMGKFSPEYLSLPSEVLSTCMKRHQKIFAVYDGKGCLQPRFAAVLNGRKPRTERIVKDYQSVLEAKLRDARFFYLADTKEKLDAQVPRLKDIIFLGRLGHMHDKVRRLMELADWMAGEKVVTASELKALKRAAFLCKADLLTHMVYEFPELQGLVGKEYARVGGEAKEVCDAIHDHYLPRSLGETYKSLAKLQSRLGSLLAIADKLDTVVGAFGIGLEPTGSQDPYALRRAGGGAVKIIRAFHHRLNMDQLIMQVIRLYGDRLTRAERDIVGSLENFFKERIAFELGVSAGSREDEILTAVLKTSWSDIEGVFVRYEALKGLYQRNRNGFWRAHKVIERTHNILKGAGQVRDHVNTELLKEPLERKLYDLIEENKSQVRKLAGEEKFDEVTAFFGSTFHDPLHDFFDRVLVNVEDMSLRENRQAMMKIINRLYVDQVADLSVVTSAG